MAGKKDKSSLKKDLEKFEKDLERLYLALLVDWEIKEKEMVKELEKMYNNQIT